MNVGSAAKARQLASSNPVALMLFDVLWLEGRSTIEAPYTERRAVLERLALAGPNWQTPPTRYGEGAVVYRAAQDLGLEGVVAKRADSAYRPGERSREWRKTKVVAGQELVVGGWLPGKGRLERHLGSLLVGYHESPGGPLRYAGRVGSGITEATRAMLEAELAARRRDTAPFEDPPRMPEAVWVEPEVVVAVAFAEWTSVGSLRAPRFKGVRDDVDPADVVREGDDAG
jgi:bifunctional non-homologous end joining protein LigD